MESEISNIIKTYKDLALYPSPKSAILRVSPDLSIINIYSEWSIPDLIKAESTKFNQEFLLQFDKEMTLLSKGVPSDISSVSLCAFTKSGTKFAALRKSKKNDESVFLEIWNLSQKESTFDMSDRKEHGKILDIGDIQSFEWSTNEKYLLYIAEAKQKKTESYFKDLFCEKNDEKSSEMTRGEENLYHETWGETYFNVHHTVLCIFEVETGKVEILNLEEKSVNASVGQATWGPNNENIVFSGYIETPSRLGLVYCSNRRSSIFSYNLENKNVERLTYEENVCTEYPVFSPNFEFFLFLQNNAGGPHASCKRLMKCNWKNKISTLIDIIDSADAENFTGLYIRGLSSRWWSGDSQFFFFHSARRSFMELYYVDVISSKVKKVKIDKCYGSCVLLDVKDPYILVSVSSPNIKPHMMIGYFTKSEDGIHVIWNLVEPNSKMRLEDLSWNVHALKPSILNKSYPDMDYDIITVTSNSERNGTLIIFPHGGPHSAILADFYGYIAAFARLGYIVCIVNYRGSIGFGENSIQSLLGNIGNQDVADVVNAVEFLKQDEKLDIKIVMGFGGSHGGFLIAHLLGQFPDMLKAAVIRNPVIDLTTMIGCTDIPDWTLIESGSSEIYDPSEITNPPVLKEMWEKSPIKYMKNVKSPTLLCLGKNDLRVPPYQGLQFHRYLKAQNVPTKVYCYDDNHALSKVGVASDVFMQTALWFQSHLPFDDSFSSDHTL